MAKFNMEGTGRKLGFKKTSLYQVLTGMFEDQEVYKPVLVVPPGDSTDIFSLAWSYM